MKPKFNIGDAVWRATWDYTEKWVACPDCGETRSMTVTLWDKTEHVIPCVGCARGYGPSSGVVSTYTYVANAHSETVTGLQVKGDNYEYRTTGSCMVEAGELFATREEAMERAAEMTIEKQREADAKIYKKDKPSRDWAWHVHYHRRCAKRAQVDLEYHTAKLNAAKTKAKKPEVAE